MIMSGGTIKVIGTHDGKFHADEVLGCFLLKQLSEYKDAIIKRTRDPEILSQCDIVIDVGGVYDHSKRRYDHHQKNFNDTFRTVTGVEEDIKLSSAGLIWAHYGKDVIEAMVSNELSTKEIHDTYCHLYKMFIQEIDGKDNGIEAADPPYRYRVSTDLSSRISRLNASPFIPEMDGEIQFMKAFELAGKEFSEIMEHIIKLWLPSRAIVAEALDDRFSIDPSGKIIKFGTTGINWPSHLRNLEAEKKIGPEILFVLFPDSDKGWRVQAVSKDGGFLLRRRVLPTCLALRDEELVASCGIKDAFFVHANGFIGGAKTYDGALRMAQESLKVCLLDVSDDIQ